MTGNNILTVLAENRDSFSKRQQKVARYICDNCEKAAFLTADQLSQAAGVSESTVVRFAALLGFENYPNMRRAIQQVLRGRLAQLRSQTQSDAEDSAASVLASSIAANTESLSMMENERNRRCFENIVALTKQCRNIYLLGSEGRAPLAEYIAIQLCAVSVCARAVSGDALFAMQNISQGDMLLCVGAPDNFSAEFRLAGDRGATRVLLWDSGTVQSTVYADHLFVINSAVEIIGFTEALVAAVCMSTGETVDSLRKKTEKILAEYREYEH